MDNNQFPPAEPSPAPSTLPPPPSPDTTRKMPIIIGAIALVSIIGGIVASSYLSGSSAGSSKYEEGKFFTNLLLKSASIESSSYSASFTLGVGERDAGAEPFSTNHAPSADELKRYENDSGRARDASALLATLSTHKLLGNDTFPSKLNDVAEKTLKSYYGSFGVVDQATGQTYGYKTTDGGKNFALTMTFETADAISSIKRTWGMGYSATATPISGKTVTFTKDSSPYVYVPSEPPKPFLVNVNEMLRMMPADVEASASVSAASEAKGGDELSDWKFNFDAEGAFGDLTYKFNIDALKKDKDYYFRVNNMPSLFFGSVSAYKGKWIRVPADETAPSDPYGGEVAYFAKQFPEFEREYKKNQPKYENLVRKAASIPDDVKLVRFRGEPKKESVGEKELTKYDIGFRKEAVAEFYARLTEVIDKDPELKSDYNILSDEGMVEYLKSPQFDEFFDYLDKNMTLVVWVDDAGYPVIVENRFRIVPPDTAMQLKGKQVDLTYKVVLNDINKDVKIDRPSGAESLEKIVNEYKANLYGSDPSSNPALKGADAQIKSSLANTRAQAEIAYDNNGNSYGKKAFRAGPCKATASTLFAEEQVLASLNEATKGGELSGAYCASSGSDGNIQAYAVSVPLATDPSRYWCIDSRGSARTTSSKLSSAECK